MKYFFVAGERSGDLHAGNLAKEIKKLKPEAELVGWGGAYMKKEGVQILQRYEELAFMGFIEVLLNLPRILGFMRKAKIEILAFNPDALILVDYAGFNLRLARWATRKNIKVFYYIAPKAWAWNNKRANKLRKYTDLTLCIFPFEIDFFKSYGVNAKYVGNPLFDAIRDFKATPELGQKLGSKPVIALLPGSRKQEISRMLESMAALSKKYKEFKWVVAGVNSFDSKFYRSFGGDFELVFDQTYDLLSIANVALVTSGTATLETALFKVPQVVVYKASPVSYAIAKLLIKIKYISLVNLVAEKEVVKELIQHNYTTERAFKQLSEIMDETKARKYQLRSYEEIIKKLGDTTASSNAAKEIINYK